MKRAVFILTAVIAIFVTGCGSSPSSSSSSSSQKLPAITIINNTGYNIWYLRISPAHEETWGRDLLGRAVLPDGNSFVVDLPYPISEVNVYDIQLVDEDTDTYTKWEVTVRNNAVITFTFDDLD
jgi:hypothetical protein